MKYSLLTTAVIATMILAGCTSADNETSSPAVTVPPEPLNNPISDTEVDEELSDESETDDAPLETPVEVVPADAVEDVEEDSVEPEPVEEEVISDTESGSTDASAVLGEIPLPDQATVTVVNEEVDSRVDVSGVVFTSSQTTDVIYSFYEGELADLGWELSDSNDVPDFAILKANKNDQQLDILILRSTEAGVGSETTITITK